MTESTITAPSALKAAATSSPEHDEGRCCNFSCSISTYQFVVYATCAPKGYGKRWPMGTFRAGVETAGCRVTAVPGFRLRIHRKAEVSPPGAQCRPPRLERY